MSKGFGHSIGGKSGSGSIDMNSIGLERSERWSRRRLWREKRAGALQVGLVLKMALACRIPARCAACSRAAV